MYSLPSRWSSSCCERPAEQPGAGDLDLPAAAVLGDDPDLLPPGHVGHVAGDGEAASRVPVVAVERTILGVDQLVQLALDLDRRRRAGPRRAAARPAPRRGRGASVCRPGRRAARGGTCRSCRRARPFSRSRGSPRRTIGRTLMGREYTQRPRGGIRHRSRSNGGPPERMVPAPPAVPGEAIRYSRDSGSTSIDHGAPGGGQQLQRPFAAQHHVPAPAAGAAGDVGGRRPEDGDRRSRPGEKHRVRGRGAESDRPWPRLPARRPWGRAGRRSASPADRTEANRSGAGPPARRRRRRRRSPSPPPGSRVVRLIGLDDGQAGHLARPARPTAWVSSWKVRSAARSSGRLRATSAETTPTSVTSGMSRPLATRLVPTRTSILPSAKASRTRCTAPLCSATSRSRRPDSKSGEGRPNLLLDPLRAAAQVADPGRAAGRAARRQRRSRPAVVAAQRHAGLVDRRGCARTPGSAGRSRSRGRRRPRRFPAG